MSWAKFDDHFDDDPDCDAVGEIGICLFLCSITWSSRNLTDGFIPAARVKKLPGGADKAAVAALLSVKWWEQVEGGYQIRSFLRYNRSKEEVLAERERQRQIAERRSEAGQRGGQRSGEARAKQYQNQQQEDRQPNPGDATSDEANSEANLDVSSSKNEANNEANNSFCLPENEANDEPPVSRIPCSESRLPNPAAAPPTSPQPGESPPGKNAAAAAQLRFSGQSNGMSAMHSILPAVPLPIPDKAPLPDKPPLLVLLSEDADARQLSRALQDCGVSRQEADALVAEAAAGCHGFSFTDIQNQIDWLPYQNARNPGYWLPRYIRDGTAKPKVLVDAECVAKRQENRKMAEAGPSRAERDAQAKVQAEARLAYGATLTDADMAAVEAEAEAILLEASFWRDYVRDKGRETRSWIFNLGRQIDQIIDRRLSDDAPCPG